MKPERILITGSSGCLAFPLAQALSEEGRAVVGLDIVAPGENHTFHSIVGDLCDPHLLHRLFLEHRFDAVVHCGGISGAMVASDDPFKTCYVNVFGTVHLLEAARVHNAARFIYCSSQGAYGDVAVDRIYEDTRFEPVTTYGATKASCDLLVRSYAVQHGLDATSIRIGRVYGPGRRTSSIVSDMVRAAIAQQPLHLSGGDLPLQYVYEADVSRGLQLALDHPRLPRWAYNVAGPGEYTDKQLAERVMTMVPGTVITFDDRPRKANSVPAASLDYQAAVMDMGYQPVFDIDAGLKTMIDAWSPLQV
jgi:nucleoside-diphosphate-sugar epimerase